MASPMAGALALMIEFREEVAVVLCMVVFACSAALVLVEIFAADLARPTASLARREPLCEAPALSEVAACAPRRVDSPTKRTTTTTSTTTTTTTGDTSCESAPARTSGPAVIQRRARASKPRARTALPTAGGPVMPRTAAGARGSSDQSRSSPETVAATLLSSATAALASIPEDKCTFCVRMKCACQQESPINPWRACSDFKKAVTESLLLECESLPDGDELAQTFEEASRNICKRPYETFGSSWSATEDQDEETSPGPSASSARSRSTRGPSLRVTLHASLPHASAKKRGLAARASIELPEDGSPPQLHFRRNGVTAAFLVLDGESVTASLITTPSPKAERGAAVPNVSQWLKLSHAEGTCDVYAFADLGWQALLPHVYS